MARSIAVDQFPQPALPTLATAISPGAMPATRITQAQLDYVADALANGGSGTLGGDYTSFNLDNLSCDTYGGFMFVLYGFSVSTVRNDITLLVNGAAENLSTSGIGGHSGSTPTLFGASTCVIANPNYANGVAGTAYTIEVTCLAPWSGAGSRLLHVTTLFMSNGTGPVYDVNNFTATYASTAEITRIGVLGSAAGQLAAASRYLLRRF